MKTRKRKDKEPAQQDLHGLRALGAVVAIALENIPADRIDINAIVNDVKHIATAAEWLAWGERHIKDGVRAALRTRDAEGLPRAVSLDDTYRDPKQLEFREFVEWAYERARDGHHMFERVRQIARQCAEQTGRTFDPDEVIKAVSSQEPFDDLLARLTA